ncbi:MAG: Omp28 family outer membrane lipoprotein [Bacteroidales bacterium]|nr:Omp28 family outer membrane lipoprotein [Bacteroidales bacterium]
MKRIISIFNILSLAALFAFSSCDKIEADDNGNYITFAGATGEWTDGGTVSDHSQRVFLEKYTGVRCINCPTADAVIHDAMSKYGPKLIPVAIHDSGTFSRPFSGNPDLRTEDGNVWSKYFGVVQYPSALINRSLKEGSANIADPTSSMDGAIDAILGISPSIAVEVNSQKTGGGTLNISTKVEFLQNVEEKLTLTLLLMEDSIIAKQSQPNGTTNDAYVHNHVLRDVITDVWGMDVDADGRQGTRRAVTIDYNGLKSDWNLARCHVVAIVSNKDSRAVVNAAECKAQ